MSGLGHCPAISIWTRDWQGSPAADDPRNSERGSGGAVGLFLGALCADMPSYDPSREAFASDAVAESILFDPLGATGADGAAGVRISSFRWFVGIGVDDAVWDHSTFSKNRDRLLEGDLAAKLLGAVLTQPPVKRLLSTDHFSVDGTLVKAWASMKSFQPKDGSGETASRRRTEPRGGFPWPEPLQ